MTLPAGAREARRVGGGDINEAWRVTLADGRDAFVKTRADAGEGEYAAEADGLAWLAEPGALRTPRVLEVGADYLALQWVEPGRLSEAGARELGRGLAATHAAGAPCFGDPRLGGGGGGDGADGEGGESGGGSRADGEGDGGGGGAIGGGGAMGDGSSPRREPARIGSLRLPNEPARDWPSFYAERRLLPLAAKARERSALSKAGVSAVERVCARIGELSGPAESPARLHGDLWSGNVLADASGRPWLVDPTVYGGHREIDLAMLRLFGAPSRGVFDAYDEVSPLSDGWEERVELWQLLPLLVHALLFGGSYCRAAERIALRYAG